MGNDGGGSEVAGGDEILIKGGWGICTASDILLDSVTWHLILGTELHTDRENTEYPTPSSVVGTSHGNRLVKSFPDQEQINRTVQHMFRVP